jgi:hypothetical protein
VAVAAKKKKLLSLSRFKPSQYTTNTKDFAGQAAGSSAPALHSTQATWGIHV